LLAIVSLVFLPQWIDYVRALLNARGALVSPLYSLKDVPLMLIPVIARFGHETRLVGGWTQFAPKRFQTK